MGGQVRVPTPYVRPAYGAAGILLPPDWFESGDHGANAPGACDRRPCQAINTRGGTTPVHHDTITLGIVEPQALVREGLTALLERDSSLTVTAATATIAEMLAILPPTGADLVLLGLDGSVEHQDCAWDVMANGLPFPSRLVVLTTETNPASQVRLRELGVRGIVQKDHTGDMLVKAITKVHAGELWFERLTLTAMVTRRLPDGPDEESAKVASLTVREREIVALVADGLTNGTIGERLFISPITVRNHLTSIFAKIDVADRFQLAVYAYRRGLVLCPATAEMRSMAAVMKGEPVGPRDVRIRAHRREA
jgi:DNA-binding NarL/FixJ family response regulator